MDALSLTLRVIFKCVAYMRVAFQPFLDSVAFNKFQRSVLSNTFSANTLKRVWVHVDTMDFDRFVKVLIGVSAYGTQPIVAVTSRNVFESPAGRKIDGMGSDVLKNWRK